MRKAKAEEPKKDLPPSRPTLSPEAQENRLISLAYDAAEKQLREGTASSQVITHFLKLGSSKERLEKEILAEQKKLIKAKTDTLESSQRIEEMYKDAMAAMKSYGSHTFGGGSDDEPEDI